MRYEEFVNIQLGKLKKAGLVDPDKIPDMDLPHGFRSKHSLKIRPGT